MRHSHHFARGVSCLIGVSAAAFAFALSAPPATAASTQTSSIASSAGHWTVETTQGRHAANKRYFIEFRARSAASYGHMYVLYGRVDARDQIVESRIAGLHPSGDAANCFNCSLFNWTVGHVIFVPSETGASDGDLEEKYVTARYRVWMDRAHYKELDTYIRKLQHDNPLWNALWNNCVEFGRSIATHMRLKMPLLAWQEPKDFVTDLREMNGIKKEQLPLEDASNSLHSTTVHSASTTPIPPQKPKVRPVSETHPAVSKGKPSSKPKKPVAELPHEQALASSAAR